MGRVLVVDDDRGIKRGVAMMLRGKGYEVDEAADGCEAVRLLSRVAYNLIITDLIMPRMNGLEVLTWVRRHMPSTPCLLMTSHHAHDMVEEARELTEGQVLAKPFSLETMESRVQSLVQGRAPTTEWRE